MILLILISTFFRCKTNTWLLCCWDVEFYFLGLMYFYCKHCRVCSSSFEWTQKSHPLVKSSIPCYRVGLNEIFCTRVWNSTVRTIARTQNVLWFINKYILHTPCLLMSKSFLPLSVFFTAAIDTVWGLQVPWLLYRYFSVLASISLVSGGSRGCNSENAPPSKNSKIIHF